MLLARELFKVRHFGVAAFRASLLHSHETFASNVYAAEFEADKPFPGDG
jgi:hypothetical protein